MHFDIVIELGCVFMRIRQRNCFAKYEQDMFAIESLGCERVSLLELI